MMSEDAPQPTEPALPAWKAFVVQFSRDADGETRFSGRVEHLHSGRRAQFASAEELVDALRRLLGEQAGESGLGGRPRS